MNSSSNVMQLFDSKKCSACGEVKALSEFSYSKHSKCYIAKCKPCNAEYCKKHRGAYNAEKQKIRHLRHQEKLNADPERIQKVRNRKNTWNRSAKYYDNYYNRRFGISLEQVQKMHSIQNGLCANIGCSKPIKLGSLKNNATFAVDHDHETGKVRGLLCTRCNCMLGHIEKNRSLVPGMMDYLNKHS